MSTSDLHIILFEFQALEPLNFGDNGGLAVDKKCLNILRNVTNDNWVQCGPLQRLGADGHCVSFTNDNGASCVFRFYMQRKLITVDVQELSDKASFTCKVLQSFRDAIEKSLKLKSVRAVPSKIPRVSAIPQLFFSSDERLSVYDFKAVLCNVDSKYQNVKVLTSAEFGNVLVLDDFVNLAEKDLIYTRNIMWHNTYDYTDKEVLILGGGDGGILNELLKQNPKFVTMIEIDEIVMEMCAKYLRGACGSCLDSPRKGFNFEVIVDDCFVRLDRYIKEGRTFDVVISDLTDVPLINDEETKHKEFWDLMRNTLKKGLSVLNPTGLFLTHLVGLTSTDVIENYERMLSEWTDPKLCFKRAEEMVPSFMEFWTFYMIWPERV